MFMLLINLLLLKTLAEIYTNN